jgi:alcohol dehydrogenase (cytochrome c)
MVNGVQYVAILAGVGGWPGVVVGWVDARVPNAALGFAGAMPDLPSRTSSGSTLMVFALPGPLKTAGPDKPETTGQAQPAQTEPPGYMPWQPSGR